MFNKKEIQRLRSEVNILLATLAKMQEDIRKLEKRKEYFSPFEAIPEDSIDYYFMKHLKAIIDYLGINIVTDLEEDPNYLKPQPQMRRIFKAVKAKKP